MIKTRVRFSGLVPAALLVATLGILELASTLLYDLITPPAGRIGVKILRGEIPESEIDSRSPHPYMLYINTPSFTANGLRQHNSVGHRGPELPLERKPGTIRILAQGGSTTYGDGVADPADAWPAKLELELERRLEKDVEVINAGLPWGMSSESLTHYLFRDRFYAADYVILHEGGNDTAPLMMQQYRPDYANFRRWTSAQYVRRPGERLLLRSALMRTIYAWWLQYAGAGRFEGAPPDFTEIPREARIRNVTNNEPVGFRRNLEALTRNIKADGAVPILFPYYLPERGILEARKEKLRGSEGLYDASVIGLAKNVAVMRELSTKEQIALFELPEKYFALERFVDVCHLDREGETQKARAVADFLEFTFNGH